MLDLRTDIPVKEDCIEQVQSLFAQMKDIMQEATDVLHLAVKSGDYYMTREELADYFKCDVKKIPRSIPKLRVGNKYRYLRSDVDKYIQQNTR